MPATVVAASLEHIQEPLDIRIRIGMRIFQRIADACLRGEMDDDGEAVLGKQRLRCFAIGEIGLHEMELRLSIQDIEARLFQRRIVIIVDAVEADDLLAKRKQSLRNVKADETGSAGDEDLTFFHAFTDPALTAATTR